ncbi:hypothetical protein GC169_10970 [bacterium]|nr:hypothetical protein [bacterium]
MKSRWPARLMALSIGAGALAGSASAEVKAIGRYNDWRVFTETVDRDLVCYAATEANDLAPKATRHGEVNFVVATWRSGSASDQPSLKVGYTLRPDLPPVATIGRERFQMFAVKNEAFVEDSSDKALVAALKKGSELRVEAAAPTERTAYSFSLKGSSDAIDKARALCRR